MNSHYRRYEFKDLELRELGSSRENVSESLPSQALRGSLSSYMDMMRLWGEVTDLLNVPIWPRRDKLCEYGNALYEAMAGTHVDYVRALRDYDYRRAINIADKWPMDDFISRVVINDADVEMRYANRLLIGIWKYFMEQLRSASVFENLSKKESSGNSNSNAGAEEEDNG